MSEETFDEKANNIQRQHIEEALNYISRCGVLTEKKIHYLEREVGKYAPDSWAHLHEHKNVAKWIGVKETIRVAYLYAVGEAPNSHFSDEDLHRIGPPAGVPREECNPAMRWGTQKAVSIMKKHGFSCERRDSELPEDGDE